MLNLLEKVNHDIILLLLCELMKFEFTETLLYQFCKPGFKYRQNNIVV